MRSDFSYYRLSTGCNERTEILSVVERIRNHLLNMLIQKEKYIKNMVLLLKCQDKMSCKIQDQAIFDSTETITKYISLLNAGKFKKKTILSAHVSFCTVTLAQHPTERMGRKAHL